MYLYICIDIIKLTLNIKEHNEDNLWKWQGLKVEESE